MKTDATNLVDDSSTRRYESNVISVGADVEFVIQHDLGSHYPKIDIWDTDTKQLITGSIVTKSVDANIFTILTSTALNVKVIVLI